MDISAKVQQLWDDVSTLRNEVSQMREKEMEQNETIINLIEQQNELIKKLLSGDIEEGGTGDKKSNFFKVFPIQTQSELDEFENSITEANKEDMVTFLKPILMPLGLKKNMRYVLSTEIAINYNVDGSHGKARLLDYPKLLNLLFRATTREGWSYKLFMDDLRMGLQTSKKKHFRKVWKIKKAMSDKQSRKLEKLIKTGVEEDSSTGDDDDQDEQS